MTPVPHAPGKKAFWSTRPDGVGSIAPVFTISPIHVLPIIEMSGVALPAMAAVILSWATSQPRAVTLTVTPGLACSNFWAKASSFSPSVPIAQTVTVPLALAVSTAWASSAAPPDSRPHAVAARATASRPMAYFFTVPPVVPGVHATARPDDEVGGENARGVRGLRSGDQLVQEAGGGGAELPEGLAHGGEGGAGVAGGHDVVPAGDGDVLGDPQPELLGGQDHAERDLVVGAHHHVGFGSQQRETGFVAAFDRVRALDRPRHRDAVVAEGAGHGRPALADVALVVAAGQRERAVAVGDQVHGQLLGGVGILTRTAWVPGWASRASMTMGSPESASSVSSSPGRVWPNTTSPSTRVARSFTVSSTPARSRVDRIRTERPRSAATSSYPSRTSPK